MRIEAVVFCGYVFLRHVLAKVLTCHLPEHKLKPSGGLGVSGSSLVVLWGRLGPGPAGALGESRAVP